jgi:uncharacterized protein YdaU (DUF1376 family)
LFLFWEFCGDAEMHFYKFHIGDYMSHTRHLSLMEDLAYRRLLDFYFLHEQPIKHRDAARQIGMRDNEEDVLTVLNEFFLSTDDGFVNPRANKEIMEFKVHQATSAYGAFVRDNPTLKPLVQKDVYIQHFTNGSLDTYISTLKVHDVSGMYTSSTHDATTNHKPLTTNHNHNHNSVSKDTGDKPPLSTDEIIFGYGVPLLTNAGATDKSARSFLGSLRKAHGDETLVNTLRDCIRAKPIQPLEWLAKALPPDGIKPKLNKQESLEASNRAVVEKLLKKEGFV